jgi:hypothetical protein
VNEKCLEFAVNCAQEGYFSCAVRNALSKYVETIKQILGFSNKAHIRRINGPKCLHREKPKGLNSVVIFSPCTK